MKIISSEYCDNMSSTAKLHSCEMIGIQLYEAASTGKTEIIEKKTGFRNYANAKYGDLQETPLHAAIRNGHLAAAERLVELGVREDIVDSTGNYPLHLAAARCEPRLVRLLQNSLNNPRIINQVNTAGDTPIFCVLYADDDSCTECIKELVAHNADVNTPGKCGSLPIELSVKVEKKACDLFMLLAPKTSSLGIIQHVLESLVEGDNGYYELDYANYPVVFAAAFSVIPNVWDIFVKVEKKKKDQCILSKQELRFNSFLDSIFAAGTDVVGSTRLNTVAEFGNNDAFLFQLQNTEDAYLPEEDEEDYTITSSFENPNITDSTVCKLLQRMKAKWSTEHFATEKILYHAVDKKMNQAVDYLIETFPVLVCSICSFYKVNTSPLLHYIKVGTSPATLKKMLYVADSDIVQEQLTDNNMVKLCIENVPELQVPFLNVFLEFDREGVMRSLAVPWLWLGYVRPDDRDESVLHLAVVESSVELCEFLLSLNPSLANTADYKGMLPISYAIGEQSDEMVLMLLRHTPDPNDFISNAAFGISDALNDSRLSRGTIEQLLLKGLRCCEGDRTDEDSDVIIDNDLDNQWLSRWCTCVWQDSERPSLPSHEAAAAGRNAELQRLAVAGATDWCLVDSMHRTVLHVAIQNPDITRETIQLLVENGALVNRVGGPNMQTPLHVALEEERLDVCMYLLSHGAESCIADNNCDSPIHKAIHNGWWEVVWLMIKTSKDLGKCNARGSTVLTAVIRDRNAPYDIIETLISLGANVNFHTSQYNRTDPHEYNGTDVNAWPGLLHLAVLWKDLKLVKLLCNENISKCEDLTTIQVMVCVDDLQFAAEVLPDLLRYGEDINFCSEILNCTTALEVAADNGSVGLMELLITHGAKLDIPRETTLGNVMISDRCSPEVILALIQAGADINAQCSEYNAQCSQQQSCCCDRQGGFHGDVICSLLRRNKSHYRLKFLCRLAIHFELTIRDVRLNSEEFQAAVGKGIYKELSVMNQCPRSLTVQCRDVIRRRCRPGDGCEPHRCLGATLEAVSVPQVIKKFLKMEDVDLDNIRSMFEPWEVEEEEPCQSYIQHCCDFMDGILQ